MNDRSNDCTTIVTQRFHNNSNNPSQCHLHLLHRHKCTRRPRWRTVVRLPSLPRILCRLVVHSGAILVICPRSFNQHQRIAPHQLITTGLEECWNQHKRTAPCQLITTGLEECARLPWSFVRCPQPSTRCRLLYKEMRDEGHHHPHDCHGVHLVKVEYLQQHAEQREAAVFCMNDMLASLD